MKNSEIIDAFCHWMPDQYYQKVKQISWGNLFMLDRAKSIPVISDLDQRFRLMDQFPQYRQLVSLVSPSLENLAGPNKTPELAKIANDAAADSVQKYPERFYGFVASLPTNNVRASLAEINRSIRELKACGVQLFTNIQNQPVDDEQFLPIFELAEQLDCPIWLHPSRGMSHPDYLNEKYSKYEIWWSLGWLYETSVAMTRLVFAGIFEKFPRLKIITHHAGAMIPIAEGRLGPGMDSMGSRTPNRHKELFPANLTERPIEFFKKFYIDTASFASRLAIEAGLNFFGTDRLIFATDMPFGPNQGATHISDTIEIIKQMPFTDQQRRQIFSNNIRGLTECGK